MKNKTPRIVLSCLSLGNFFLMIGVATMEIIDANLAAVVGVSLLINNMCLYWICDGLSS